ncbi:Heterokaryon incompatibility protein [Hyphodiscus hymeniophilus]|uniref:Heterokaryon incompatibility protein n=1 Tax=Hyphodiscus hymeniophilus TaxID=353542 RepID=A0A9P6VK43_9HELO|nr:Heterokaryon incompatibility protein [Hyphodiscus hymeniophilus]
MDYVPHYQYPPLLQNTQYPIRILNLHAGKPGRPLSCDLRNTSLEQSPPPSFDALSYVWGPPDAHGCSICVDRAKGLRDIIYIRASLKAALLRLRHPTENRAVWVDALCINQADDVERSMQVPMMGKIYRSASSVIIWLGEEAEESELALDFIPRVTDLAKFDHIIKDQASTRQWYALSRLMNRPWFSRRWVVQELAFAKDAWLFCGDREIDWASFADAATLFGKRQQDIAKLFWMSPEYAHDAEIFGDIEAFGALRLINALTRLFRHSESGQILEGLVSLETLVTSLDCFGTKDPRDSIYAVIHLAEEAHTIVPTSFPPNTSNTSPHIPADSPYPTLTIDYSLPFDEIARGFVGFCIRNSNSLDIVCRPWAPIPSYYFPDGSYQTRQRLSSWACTLEDSVFEIREDGHHVRRRGDTFVGIPGRPIYQASKWFPSIPFGDHYITPYPYMKLARFPVDAISSEKAPRMEVKGLGIGTIQFVGERAMEGTIPSGWFSMAQWAQRRHPVPDAFYRTLIADRSANGGNPPSWYKRAFEHALVNSGTGDVRPQRMINQSKSTVTAELLARVQSVIWNRRFAITDQGAYGLVPANAQSGDAIMILHGASVPVILRRLDSSYCLIGESYIHGAMDGLKTTLQANALDINGGVPNVQGGPTLPMNGPKIISIR